MTSLPSHLCLHHWFGLFLYCVHTHTQKLAYIDFTGYDWQMKAGKQIYNKAKAKEYRSMQVENAKMSFKLPNLEAFLMFDPYYHISLYTTIMHSITTLAGSPKLKSVKLYVARFFILPFSSQVT